MALSPDIAPSQGNKPLKGPSPEVLATPNSRGITQGHIDKIGLWQNQLYPEGEPLSRQAGQFRRELAETGEEVIGLTSEQLSNLPVEVRDRIGDEVGDIIISGVGLIKVLEYSYEDLRHKRENAVYDSSSFTEFERWQIDANGGETPVKLRLEQLGESALIAHKTYDELGTEELSELTDAQTEKLAREVAVVIDNGLSVLNGLGLSFDAIFRRAYGVMEEKYSKEIMDELRRQGLSTSEAVVEAKRRWSERLAQAKAPEPTVIYTSQE